MKLVTRIFEDSGSKIKNILKIIYLIEAICILIGAVGVVLYGVYTAIQWEEWINIVYAVVAAPIAAFLSLFFLWLFMLPVYSYAELVSSATACKNSLANLSVKVTELPEIPVAPAPAAAAPTYEEPASFI